MAVEPNTGTENLHFSSSIAADVWHASEHPASHHCWYFDALSDDGRDAVVIFFFDNFIFSPRYNAAQQKNGAGSPETNTFPAVALYYYHDGKLLYGGVSEYNRLAFSAD